MLSALSTGHAAPECGKRKDIVDHLKRTKDETTVVLARADDFVVEIFASPRGETWTLTVVGPTGAACIVRSGTDWEFYQPGGDPA